MEKEKTPIRAIREKCVDCCGGQRHEPKWCPVSECALWPYRLGSRPSTVAKRKPQFLDLKWVMDNSPLDCREKDDVTDNTDNNDFDDE